jgi:hypothetical protein
MIDIIKNKIDINEFNTFIQGKEHIQQYVFDIINMVLNNVEFVPYLESIFIELNKRDLNILRNIRNQNNMTIAEYYKSLDNIDNIEIKNHIDKYINTNIDNLLYIFNMPKEPQKPINDILLERIIKLENEVDKLKIWIANKDFISNSIR